MNFKNIILSFIVAFALCDPIIVVAQNKEKTQAVVPLFSPRQLVLKMRKLGRGLNKVKRCLFTVQCTAEEQHQVNKKLGILFVAATVIFGGAVIWRITPRVKGILQKELDAIVDHVAERVGKKMPDVVNVAAGAVKAEIPDLAEKVANELKAKMPIVANAAGNAIKHEVVLVLNNDVLKAQIEQFRDGQIDGFKDKILEIVSPDGELQGHIIECIDGIGNGSELISGIKRLKDCQVVVNAEATKTSAIGGMPQAGYLIVHLKQPQSKSQQPSTK